MTVRYERENGSKVVIPRDETFNAQIPVGLLRVQRDERGVIKEAPNVERLPRSLNNQEFVVQGTIKIVHTRNGHQVSQHDESAQLLIGTQNVGTISQEQLLEGVTIFPLTYDGAGARVIEKARLFSDNRPQASSHK